MSLRIHALPATDLDRVRSAGVDDHGNPVDGFTADGGEPLRCCLRDADTGERCALIAWRPSSRGGAYAETGPVFVHADRCEGYRDTGYPEAFRDRRQLLRAYSPDGRQVTNVIAEAGAVEAGLQSLLLRPDVAFVHTRNVLAGCYMLTAVWG